MTTTPILGLTQIDPTGVAKLDTINANFGVVEGSTDSFVTHDLSSGDVIVTATQFTQNYDHKTTGNSVARALTVPATKRVFCVTNGGTHDLTVTVSGGSSVTVLTGLSAILTSDGSVPAILAEMAPPASTFAALSDGFTYTGKTTKRVRVNSGESALEAATAGSEIPVQIDKTTEYTTTLPAAPLIGLTGFVKKRAARTNLAFRDPYGSVREVETLIGRKMVAALTPTGDGSTTGHTLGASAKLWPGGHTRDMPDGGNFYAQQRRVGMDSGSGANDQCFAAFNTFAVSTAAGFFFLIRFGLRANPTAAKFFVGLNTTAGLFGSTWASGDNALEGGIGIIKDSGDAHWSLIQKRTGGTPTKTDLGADFPANTELTDVYELRLFCVPGGVPQYSFERLNTGALTEGAFVNDSTLITSTTAVMPIALGQKDGTAFNPIVGLDVARMYLETERYVI